MHMHGPSAAALTCASQTAVTLCTYRLQLRIRTVFDAALAHGHTSLVLGAFNCGAFGNPPADVAAAFARVARSAEFRGSFALLVFAIVSAAPACDLHVLL